jgi:hypothetical protein
MIKERILALKEKARQYDSVRSLGDAVKSSIELKSEIKSLYRAIFNRSLSGCSNCLTDALFEIINTKNIMDKLEYQLKAGALLKDIVNGDSRKLASQKNLTKELALYHLATNPKCAGLFAKLPKDYKKEVSEYVKQHKNAAAGIAEKQETEKPVTETEKKDGKQNEDEKK